MTNFTAHQIHSNRLLNPGVLLTAFLLCSAQTAHASFTDDLSIGNAKALSLGHAVTADPPDIDSIHFNPAGLTQLKGRQSFLKGIVGLFSTEMELGDYGPYQQKLIDDAAANYKDENGNLTPEGEAYVYDEAHNTHSESEGGPTIMLPGGMVDLPIGAGVAGGASYNPPGSKFTFATNVYSPMMNGFHRADDDPGRFAQQRVAFTVITYFSPSVGYEVSDELSLGFSVNFNYAGMGMQLPIREPHMAIFFLGSPFIQDNLCPDGDPAVSSLNICNGVPPYTEYAELNFEVDTPVALGYNLGLIWRPQPWLSLGLAYNSKIDVSMDGHYSFPIKPTFKTFLVEFQDSPFWNNLVGALGALGVKLPTSEQVEKDAEGHMKVSYELPQRLNGGLSVRLTPRWKYNLDVKWTQWSAFSNINLNFGEDVPLLMWGSLADTVGTGGANGITANSVKYQLGLQDVTYWSTGTEYQYNSNLVLRAGFQRRPSAVPKDHPNAFIPINDGDLYSLGFGYDMEEDSHLDFAVGYFSSKTHYPPCSAQLGNSCDPNNVVYNPYAGQDIKAKVEFLLFELSYQQHF